MKLASLRNSSRDGALIVVDSLGLAYTPADHVAPSLQAALDQWPRVEPELRALAAELAAGKLEALPLDPTALAAPLPRAYEWIDGSAYINHIALVRRARGAALPENLTTDPLVYQGGSGDLLGPTADIPLPDPAWGLDFESEVCVILGDTPRGVSREAARGYVRLFMLANDVTFRDLVPAEIAKGFGFFVSKPATAFSPFAVTPDELGPAYRDGRVHLHLRTRLNGREVGNIDAGAEMHFSFFDLIAHITQSRAFTAGTILGSGTVSSSDPAAGVSCLVERRMRETIERGAPETPYLVAGDRVEIDMMGPDGIGIFGTIRQQVRGV